MMQALSTLSSAILREESTFAETDETVNKKVLKAFEHGITPIVCCGESLTQREQGITIDWIRQQIKIAFLNVTADPGKDSCYRL